MMSLPKLGPRLQFIFEHLMPGLPVWDVCCDHGYLGMSVLRSGLFPEIHFVDQVPSIVAKLEAKLAKIAGSEKCRFHALDASMLQETITGNLVIAGIGGLNMIQILAKLQKNHLLRTQRIVLSAQKDHEKVKDWFLENQSRFSILQEIFIPERGRNRSVFIVNSKS
ncbi:MAG: tRNA (adenine(22)-N(1))-methyltransferase TrmK [Bdellovibrionaceae bacterium]|nr:tRNA (adenine(22)-N(1))-methyltransferase TrmK [Pseudobdellovibrionaceae bacterium]